MKKLVYLAATALILFVGLSYLKADDDDIFTDPGRVQPNVLILFDNSGSMDEELCSDVEDEQEGYCWGDNDDEQWGGWGGGWGSDDDDDDGGGWGGDGGDDNTCTQTTRVCEKKIDVAKETISDLIEEIDGVRLGLMKFYYNSGWGGGQGGAAMVAPIGSDKSTLLAGVASLTASVNATPLGDALYDSGQYYSGNFGAYASPITYPCQINHVILITDGEPNHDSRDPVSNVATSLYTTDHSILTLTQNVITHTIGIAIPSAEALLQTTASNGHGTYAKAENARQVYQALSTTFEEILNRSYSFVAPTVPSLSVSGSDKVFLASFQPKLTSPRWPGLLRAYTKDTGGIVPLDPNTGLPDPNAIVWDGGALLDAKSATSRRIYTTVSGTLEDFSTSNSSITTTILGVNTANERERVIEHTLGIDRYDEDLDGNKTEQRANKLGDIYHSVPLLVFPPPARPEVDPNYATFRATYSTRPKVLLAGANDGMLHAFSEASGEELWGFIPENKLDDLVSVTVPVGEHIFFVDGPVVAADVKTNGSWKTIAVFGQRRGSGIYTALDVSDTNTPAYLWSWADSKVVETWSEPRIGKVKMADSTEKYVMFVGGGFSTGLNNWSGDAFFIIDLANGSTLWEYYNNSNSDDRQYMNFSVPNDATILDLNHDGYIDRVYVSDVGGQIWKFDTSAAATVTSGKVTNWTGKRLFAADPNQTNPPPQDPNNPVEHQPAQAMHGSPVAAFDAQGQLWVFAGTGDRNRPNSSSSNKFFGIIDDTDMTNGTTLTPSSLVDVTSTDATPTQGWYFNLASYEKVLSSAQVADNVVYFTTYTPVNPVTCQSQGGTAQLYGVQMTTGYDAFDDNGEYRQSSDSSEDRSEDIGNGLPSNPTVVLEDKKAHVVMGTTEGTIEQIEIPLSIGLRVLYWREVLE